MCIKILPSRKPHLLLVESLYKFNKWSTALLIAIPFNIYLQPCFNQNKKLKLCMHFNISLHLQTHKHTKSVLTCMWCYSRAFLAADTYNNTFFFVNEWFKLLEFICCCFIWFNLNMKNQTRLYRPTLLYVVVVVVVVA